MVESLVFVANLDAEFELIDPGYVRSARMRASILGRLDGLRCAEVVVVLEAGDVVPAQVRDCRGECWSPTPRALEVLATLGVRRPAAPAVDVLRAVNHREFVFALGPSLPGAVFVRDRDACLTVLARAGDGPVLLKRALGFAGRMRKLVVPSCIGADERTWIDASMTGYGGGLSVEPFVDVVVDVSIHGRLDRDGSLVRGRPIILTNDSRGGFAAARRAEPGELAPAEHGALHDALDRSATALHAAGYFGPIGIDAFRWRDRAGGLHFQPLVEINARYTMAWWTGMARD